jgi:hypothetical protein
MKNMLVARFRVLTINRNTQYCKKDIFLTKITKELLLGEPVTGRIRSINNQRVQLFISALCYNLSIITMS